MKWLPSIPYPAAQEGYWAPVTSTINWCEEDYYATKYSAEIVNTLTNLLFMWLGVKGAYSCVKNGHDTIFLVSFIGYLLVGTGSFCFHSTLKYPMQLVDELSMIYTTCLMCYACFSYRTSRAFSIALAVGLLGLAIFITTYYHYIQDPTFHQTAYGILTAVVLLRSMYIMEVNIRPSLRENWATHRSESRIKTRAQQEAHNLRDEQVLRDMWLIIAFGLSIFLGGFGLWNIDNEFCGTLRRWRHDVGLPWGVLLELHGWWHVMTGMGAYCYLIWGVWLRHCLNDRQEEYELKWWLFVPDIVRIKGKGKGANGSVKANGSGNGSAKKRL